MRAPASRRFFFALSAIPECLLSLPGNRRNPAYSKTRIPTEWSGQPLATVFEIPFSFVDHTFPLRRYQNNLNLPLTMFTCLPPPQTLWLFRIAFKKHSSSSTAIFVVLTSRQIASITPSTRRPHTHRSPNDATKQVGAAAAAKLRLRESTFGANSILLLE